MDGKSCRNHCGALALTAGLLVTFCSCAKPKASDTNPLLAARQNRARLLAMQRGPVASPSANAAVAERKPEEKGREKQAQRIVAHPNPTLPMQKAAQPAEPAEQKSTIKLVNHQQPANNDELGVPEPPKVEPVESVEALPETDSPRELVDTAENRVAPESNLYTLDLATALRLGGANNLQIQLARERVIEAEINWRQKKAMILPSLWWGLVYNKHDGRIQATEGDIVEAGRNSLFFGGGAGLDDAPLAGGSSGPSRLVMNLSIADAHFEPLVACQLVDAANYAEQRDLNDTLLAIATGYFDLVEARGVLASVRDGLQAAQSLVKLTTDFFDAGEGSQTEVFRARTEKAYWQRRVYDAQRKVIGRSAELARLLRLDPNLQLVPAEDQMAPVALVSEAHSMQDLIATGLASRPELARHQSLVAVRLEQLRQETWRPLLPYIQVGASAGNFGGGPSSQYGNAGGRSDVDLLAVWEVRNLAVGNVLLRRRRDSQATQAEIEAEMLQDRITAEIVTAASDVAAYRSQIDAALDGASAARRSYESNLDRIRDAVGLPIELLQAVRARTDAQLAYSEAISDYNRAQYRLLHSLGQPPMIESTSP